MSKGLRRRRKRRRNTLDPSQTKRATGATSLPWQKVETNKGTGKGITEVLDEGKGAGQALVPLTH